MWNYKTALLSAAVRGLIFFSANLAAGLDAAAGAMLAEAAFRFVAAGFYGSITQWFRRVEPAALGTILALVLLPALAHSFEYVLHSWRHTPALAASLTASIAFTGLSTSFHLFVMRRGFLIVGEGERPLLEDLRAMPRLVWVFLVAASKTCPRPHG